MSITMYGTRWCSDCKPAKQLLGEQRIPHDFVDVDADPAGRAVVQRHNDGKDIIPTIVFDDGSVLVEPSNAELAAKLCLQSRGRSAFYDLVVVGSGPAGLTAALYAAREGLSVLVVERSGIGGQAGVTERLDNFPGFPEGAVAPTRTSRHSAVKPVGACHSVAVERVTDVAVGPVDEVPRRADVAVADLGIAGLYVPAGRGPEPTAGDFYDVLPLHDDLVALVVGDVSGHGTPALARMLQLRSAARGLAYEQQGAAAVLARLDVFMEDADPEGLATLWYGEYRPSTGVLSYGSAGHPPPALHVHGQGVRLLQPADAPPLGTGLAHVHAVQHEEVLPAGAVLVAYSDGLVERRGLDLDDQLALLDGIVARACDPTRSVTPQEIAREVLDALVPEPDRAEDDVCLLVVRRQP